MDINQLEVELREIHNKYKEIKATHNTKTKEYKEIRDKYLLLAEEFRKAVAKEIKNGI